MVMRSIPELLNDSSSHVSIAMPRHLKEGSPPPSSSSDSDADMDELPFIPMPLSVVFSDSRVSLNEISGNDGVRWPNVVDNGKKKNNVNEAGTTGGAIKSITDETPNEENLGSSKQNAIKEETSVESDESQTRARRATMRRGSSADSALLHHNDPDAGSGNEDSGVENKGLKKTVSMELPNRSPSPSAAKLSQEEYALKLELMRQRLLRGGSIDKKMSGLRGPLFETLGMENERRSSSLNRNLRSSKAGPSSLTRAVSSECSEEDMLKTKVHKSVSFTQGDSEPMPLHRRFGAPLVIPSASCGSMEGKNLQEATSVSALTEKTRLESLSSLPREKTSFRVPAAEDLDQQHKESNVEEHEIIDRRTKTHPERTDRTPIIVIEVDNGVGNDSQMLELNENKIRTCNNAEANANNMESNDTAALPEHPAVFAKIATEDKSPASVSSYAELPTIPRHPVLRTDIKDIDSEEVFEARFKKRESSLTSGLRKLTRYKSEEKSPVSSRKVVDRGEEIYRPGLGGAPLELVSRRLPEKSKSVQDLREVHQETGLSLIGRFSLRAKRSTSTEKKRDKPKQDKQPNVQETTVNKRVLWAVGRSKSIDTAELNNAGTRKQVDDKEPTKAEESSVSAMRRKFESKVAGISAKIRSQSEERRAEQTWGSQKDLVHKDHNKVSESPVLAMRHRFENKMSGIATKIRSQSEERKGDVEGKSTPLFARHWHSQSEGRRLKELSIPENQLAKQTSGAASKESIESTSSIQSDRASESDRKSRWDRWGLTRAKRDKMSQCNLPSSVPKDEDPTKGQQFIRSASDFAPVFHIKLKDHVLLEGDSVTLSCLPAASPHPKITWMKGKFSFSTTAFKEI